MKTYNVTYKLNAEHDCNYIVLADLHEYFSIKLAQKIKELDAKFVIIAGDIFNGINWTNEKKLNKFKNFLNIIKENKKVIVCLGNHDLYGLSKKGFKNFKNLKEENIYPLYNETCIIGNDSFTNFLPTVSTFSYLSQEKKRTVTRILKSYEGIKAPDPKYTNHLIAHNPYHFIHNEVIKNISKHYDFIETGHFHDGWLPTKYLDKSYDLCLDKGLQEIIKNIIFHTDKYSLHVMPRRILSRGTAYMYEDGYFILLPNNKIYFYNKKENKYTLSNKSELKERLNKKRVPAIVITGAINTFDRIKVFYPYITTLKCVTKDEYKATAIIKED